MSTRTIRWTVAAVTAALAIIVLWRAPKTTPLATPTAPQDQAATSTVHQATSAATAVTSTNAFVVRHVDGDTIVARLDGQNGVVTIRLLGVNTPETVDPRRPVQCFGKEASHYTDSAVTGKRVRLDADPLADDVDKYGRLLRNVILEDGTDFDAKLVSEGYAYAYVSFPMNSARKAQLRRLQSDAQAAQRGLWSPATCNGQL